MKDIDMDEWNRNEMQKIINYFDGLNEGDTVSCTCDFFMNLDALIEEYKRLEQENRKLKKHLEVPETCSLKTLEDYKNYYQNVPKEQILDDTYIDYRAYARLKKQLEDMTDNYCNASKLKHERAIEIVMINNQQKEFIKWLEDEIKNIYPNEYDAEEVYRVHGYEVMLNYIILIEILQKYKSIIGCDE